MNFERYQIKSYSEYLSKYKKSINTPDVFWEAVAEHFLWHKKWDSVCLGDFKNLDIRWFEGGQLNITENCLDRLIPTHKNKVALYFEPNNVETPTRQYTYQELLDEVCLFAHVLKNNGVKKGDRVCIYMSMIPEGIIAMLACARIGAIHTVVFAGFSAQSIATRIEDCGVSFVIVNNAGIRGEKKLYLKSIVDTALNLVSDKQLVRKVLVVKHTEDAVDMVSERDIWLHEEIAKVKDMGLSFFPAVVMEAEDMLFIMYTSGSTAKPKGVVHTVAGYMIYANYTFVNIYQIKEGHVHFCSADIGWITGHTYLVYAPLSAGVQSVLYEGTPTYPSPSRLWQIVEKYKVKSLILAPTTIRMLMTYGTKPIEQYDLSSLKVINSIGEPLNESAWDWVHNHIGNKHAAIVDSWWQTETGGIMISSFAGITPSQKSYSTLPFFGIVPILLNDFGAKIRESNVKGHLCIKQSWPAIVRTNYSDHDRFKETYFSKFPNYYYAGDVAMKDKKGFYRILGRADEVLNVSGHRIGSAELENTIASCEAVIETAVVSFHEDIKGEGIYAFVVLKPNYKDYLEIRNQIIDKVAQVIGSFAKPDKIQFVVGLPKTRSGKIMRRILKKIANNDIENIGETSTIIDASVIDDIIRNKQS
ncbi:MAG: acetate--CoA ligase [Phycisphaerales bacterium]|nr:acetate--CoA ligase [Phycisphaerales bacterium]